MTKDNKLIIISLGSVAIVSFFVFLAYGLRELIKHASYGIPIAVATLGVLALAGVAILAWLMITGTIFVNQKQDERATLNIIRLAQQMQNLRELERATSVGVSDVRVLREQARLIQDASRLSTQPTPETREEFLLIPNVEELIDG